MAEDISWDAAAPQDDISWEPAKPAAMFLSNPDASGKMVAKPATDYNKPAQQRGIVQRAREGANASMDDLGFSQENRARYPVLNYLRPKAQELDIAARTPGSIMGGLAGAAAGIAEKVMGPAWADRMQRDLTAAPSALAGLVPEVAPETALAPRARPPVEAPRIAQPPPLPATPPPSIPRQVARPGVGVDLLQPDVPHELPPERSSLGAAGYGGPLSDVAPETIAHMRAVMEEQGFNQNTIDQRLSEMSSHHFFGEITPSLEADMGAVASPPGPAKLEVMGSLRQRGLEAPERVQNIFNRAFGENENLPQMKRLMEIERSREADPLYRQFRETEITPTPEIDALLPRLEAAGVLQGANRALRIEGQPTTRGFAIPGEPPTIQNVPTAGAFQLALEQISDKVGAEVRAGNRNEARRYTGLRNDLLSALDNHPSVGNTWRQARSAYSRPAAIQDAIEMGRNVMTNRVSADELPFLTSGYNALEMQGLRVGIRSYYEQMLGKRDSLTAEVLNSALSPNNVQKARWAIGDEAADTMVNAMEQERHMHTAPTRIHGGSPTALRIEANKRWTAQPGALDNIGVTDVAGAVAHPVRAAAGIAQRFGLSHRRAAKEARMAQLREEASHIFTLQGPQRDAVARYLVGGEDGGGMKRGGVVGNSGTARLIRSTVNRSRTPPRRASSLKKYAVGGRRFAEGGNVGDDYNTALGSPAAEQAFQIWKQQVAPNDSGADYDLRGAYQANMQRDPDNGHMGDRFKKPNHPTFSDQSQYATGDLAPRAGTWVGPEGPDQTFVPPTPYADGGDVSADDMIGRARDQLASQPDRMPTSYNNAEGDTAAMSPETYANPLVKGMIGGAADLVAGPGRLMQPNPYEPGSEEHSWYEDQRSKLSLSWARDAALATMGTGAIAGVPVKGAEAVLGAGAVRGRRALDAPLEPRYNPTHETAAGPGPGPGLEGGAGGVEEAQGAAARLAGAVRPLPGLPQKPIELGGGHYVPGPNETIHQVAQDYMNSTGRPYQRPESYVPVDPDHASSIAKAYEDMPHAPDDPRVKASYDAMVKETIDQYRALKDSGLKIEAIPPGARDPYAESPRLAHKDVAENNHLWFFPTEGGFGTDAATGSAKAAEAGGGHPLLQKTGEKLGDRDLLANDLFRVVHDYFGHLKEGNGFRASGEDNAWRTHMLMYSDAARPAMTTETRGQNSWLNYGPHGDFNRTATAADTHYADQKVGLMPDWTMQDPMRLYHASPTRFDSFSSKLGSAGEGTQSFGRGLYFAEHPEVAQSYANQFAKRGQPPYLYEASVRAQPDQFLKLEEPLRSQPQAMKAFKAEFGANAGHFSGMSLQEAMEQAARSRGHAAIPDALLTQGVPGVKYLDQGSRGAGEGTRNYVLFDDSLADIRSVKEPPAVPAKPNGGPRYYEGPAVQNAGVDARPNKSIQTVADPHRMMFPGVYRNPREIAEEAASRVGPEDPAMKQLFGVTRGDLRDMAQGRVGNEEPNLKLAPNPRGSLSAQNIQTPKNTQRLADILGEAGKHEGLRTADAWYIMDPVYRHMEQMFGPEEAAKRYAHLNTTTAMASPGSNVLSEIQRGTAAHWLEQQGRFGDFQKYGGLTGDARGSLKVPADVRYIQGHPYHRTSHAEPMQKYFNTGSIQTENAKVPLYAHASGVPETGFQTTGPVGDAHFSRGVGLADTRKGPTDVGSSFSRAEYQTLQPWWQHEVAGPAGLESVPAQARLWTALGPQTGVDSALGAPKLELLAKQIMQASRRLKVSPETARDLVLSGKAGAGVLAGATLGPQLMSEGETPPRAFGGRVRRHDP